MRFSSPFGSSVGSAHIRSQNNPLLAISWNRFILVMSLILVDRWLHGLNWSKVLREGIGKCDWGWQQAASNWTNPQTLDIPPDRISLHLHHAIHTFLLEIEVAGHLLALMIAPQQKDSFRAVEFEDDKHHHYLDWEIAAIHVIPQKEKRILLQVELHLTQSDEVIELAVNVPDDPTLPLDF